MRPLLTDLYIYKKFNFEHPIVGVKYLFEKPEGIQKLDKSLALCEMIKEAWQRESPFYITVENENCVGKLVVGWEDIPPFAESGQLGAEFEIFEEPRANSMLYYKAAKIAKGTVNYIVFSPLDKISFEPDLLFFTCDPGQAEILLRASSYSTGDIWTTKSSLVLNCSWLFAYPYISGNLNFIITGLGFGSKAKQVFTPGLIIIVVPFQLIPTVTNNLKKMKWVVPSYTDGREKFFKREHKIFEKYARQDNIKC
jgi:uncharacterized protein (DUF169 family)